MFTGMYTLYLLIVSSTWWLTVGSSALLTIVLVSMALVSPGGYPDPFMTYADLRPGQPISVLERESCHTQYSLEYSLGDGDHCVIQPDDDFFNRIMVVEHNDQIDAVTFYGENLQVVDLTRNWGKPSRVLQAQSSGAYVLTWNQGIFAVTESTIHRFNYQLAVEFVTLSNYYQSPTEQ